MAVVVAYVDAVPGRLYPLVSTLLELSQRGHRVAVRCGIGDVERLRSVGLNAQSLRREIERFEPDDWRARTRFGALSSGLGQFGERAQRSDWPAKLTLVGPGLWEPPADPPAWLDGLDRPLVFVTCSTLFQNDRRLAEVAVAALAGEPFDVVVTTADVDPTGLLTVPNVRVEHFLPHAPLLERAACVVCHAGMGITQKALAHGVPVVAVPFGRDQPEVARRVEVADAGVRLAARKLTPDRLREAVRQAVELRPGAQRIAAAFTTAGAPQRQRIHSKSSSTGR